MAKINEQTKIVLTGGHAGTTALSIVHEITKRKLAWDLYWIGSRKAHEGSDAPTLESRTLPNYGVEFISIRAGKLQRRWSKHTIPSLIKVPLGFIDAYRVLKRLKPQIVVSFGGYSSFPVVVCAWLLKIPVLLQEQITGLGFANRLSLPFAKKVALAREEGLGPSKGKGIVLGNPISPEIARLIPKSKMNSVPTLFVFAGSRGSQSINEMIKVLLPKLLDHFRVIHHTGDLDFNPFSQLHKTLKPSHRKKYFPYKFIETSDVPLFYQKSDILIGRAGANTISEIMVVGIPSIVIPLTWTNYQEQILNAKAAQKRNFVRVLDQDTLTPDKLYKTIQEIESKWSTLVHSQVRDLAELDKSASSKIVDLIEEMIS